MKNEETKLGPGYITEETACEYLEMGKTFFKESVRPYIPNYYFGRAVRFKLKDLEKWAQKQAGKYQAG